MPRSSRKKKLRRMSRRKLLELKPFLDELNDRVEVPSYIQDDPVLFMHAYDDKQDQALAGFFAAVMAWGRRDIVISKVDDLLERMNYRPAEFIGNFSESDAARLEGFKHRTFKPVDIYWLVKILKRIIENFGEFESFWAHCRQQALIEGREMMAVFHETFFAQHPEAAQRTRKHISNAEKNSSCKRLYLYLRWSIRKNSVVDPGIMDFMEPSGLKIPLDVHVARQARALGLLTRTYNDWKAVEELTGRLRLLDPEDPVRYDYALFGLGIMQKPIPREFVRNPRYLD